MLSEICSRPPSKPFVGKFIRNPKRLIRNTLGVSLLVGITGAFNLSFIPFSLSLAAVYESGISKKERESVSLPKGADSKLVEYKENFIKARKYYRAAYVSTRRMFKNIILIAALCVPAMEIDTFFPLLALPAYFLYGAGKYLTINVYGIFRRPKHLINNLVSSSLGIDPDTIAEDLFSYERRGEKAMTEKYLKGLQKADEKKSCGHAVLKKEVN